MSIYSVPFSVEDLMQGLVFGLSIIMVALVWTRVRRFPESRIFLTALTLKLVASVSYNIVVVYNYGDGDTMGYHRTGIEYADLMRADLAHGTSSYLEKNVFFWVNGWSTTRLSSLSGLIHFLCFDSFLASSFCFALMGFVGQWLLYRTFTSLYPQACLRVWWRAGILFFPSLTFWSSGILKDSVGLFALGCAVWGAQGLLHKVSMRGLCFLLVGVYSLYLFRTQVLPALLISFVPWLLLGDRQTARSRRFLSVSLIARQLVGVTLIVLSFLVIQRLGESESRYSIEKAPQNLSAQSGRYDEDGTDTETTFDSSWSGLARAAPEATFLALFRPFVWEAGGVVGQLAALENVALLFLTLRAFYKVFHWSIMSKLLRSPTFWTCLLFVLIFALIVGVSTPNLGSVSRYRIPLLPFLAAVLIIVEYHYLEKTTLVKSRYSLWNRHTTECRSGFYSSPSPVQRDGA